MSTAVDDLVFPLLHKHSLKECSVSALQQIADEHPYFTAAHLLLTKKMEEEQDEQFLHQKSKTSLYFPDPFWLDKLLHEKPTISSEVKMKAVKQSLHVFEPDFTAKRTVALEVPAATLINTNTEDLETVTDLADLSEENRVQYNAGPAPDEINQPTNGAGEESVEIRDYTESPTNIETVKIAQDDLQESEDSEIPAEEPAGPPLKETIMKTTETGSEILFEPFHTVDYFASQGIKFTEEEKPADKLGQQLKSFTEWLKILRKTPEKDISIPINPQTEQKVEKLAAHSLADREVVTEAMAEVWEKQGNKEKAKAIYDKLSLLNPSKRSYFAAKIEHLKNS